MKLLLISLVALMTFAVHAQSLERSVISALGNSVNSEGLYLSQTAGQDAVHTQKEMGSIVLRSGFEQAIVVQTSNAIKNIDFQVYPNPNTGTFTISVKSLSENYRFTLVDLQGRLIYEGSADASFPTQVVLENALQTGVYSLRLETDSGYVGVSRILIGNN